MTKLTAYFYKGRKKIGYFCDRHLYQIMHRLLNSENVRRFEIDV